jgi:hypothetical protein
LVMASTSYMHLRMHDSIAWTVKGAEEGLKSVSAPSELDDVRALPLHRD